ncbi:MAG: hypothetical protein H0U76_03915 [Ktedonobacteraceae bacterium]|nr:hypothetical protein [Ktedonobacteraceae bacterium]
MTPERAQHLVAKHGCRLGEGNETCMVVINEAISTGIPPRGQRPLPGVYQDCRYSHWEEHKSWK